MAEQTIRPNHVYLALTLIKKIVRFIWHFHRKLLISLLVTFSIIFLSLRVLAFYLEEHPQLVQYLVESELSVIIAFDKLSLDINFFSPVISMKNFAIAGEADTLDEKKNPLIFKSASIQLNTLRSLVSGQVKVDTIAVSGISLSVRRNQNNELFLAELQLGNTQNKQDSGKSIERYLQLFNQTTFIMKDSDIHFIDEMSEFPSVQISDINLQIKNRLSKHQISLSATLDGADTRLDLRLDFNGAIEKLSKWDGQIYCAVKNINKKTLLHLLREEQLQIENLKINKMQTDIKFWSAINQGSLQSISGDFKLHNAQLAYTDDKRNITFDNISSNFKFVRTPETESELKEAVWTLDLFDTISEVNGKSITEKDIKAKFYRNDDQLISKVQLFLNSLDLEEIFPILSFFSPDEFNQQVYKVLKPEGQIKDIIATVHVDSLHTPIDIKRYQVQADISGFGINALYSVPKIRNLSSRIIFNESMGRATINSSDMKLHLKSLFRDSWSVNSLSGDFFWQQEGMQWFFGAEHLQFKNPHLSIAADVNLWLSPDGGMFMDLSGFFHDANVKYVPHYLPAKVMSEGLVNWLDNAFVSGMATDGGVLFRGAFTQFPFTDQSGILDITFNTKDVLLDYNKGWPLLRDINAQIQFTGKGMGVESQHSKIFTSVSANIEAHIESYLDSILKLSGDIDSNVTDGLLFLKQTQLVSDEVLDILDVEGELGLNLDVSISLDEGQTDSKVIVKLKNNNYYPPGFERKKGLVSHLKGDILVHNESLKANKLTAQIMGHKAKIAIKTAGYNKRSRQDPKISVNIASKVSVQKLKQFSLIPEFLLPLSDHLSRSTQVNLAIDLPNTQRGLAFSLTSNLQNLKSDLPLPFKKAIGTKSPFSLSFSEIKPAKKKLSPTLAKLDIKVSNIMSLALLLNTSNERFELFKGNLAFMGARAKLPKEKLLRISGSLYDLPLTQWQSVINAPAVANRGNKIKLMKPANDNYFTLPIELAIKQLTLPKVNFDSGSAAKGAKASQSKSRKDNRNNSQNPENFPLLNGSIESLKIGELDLGRFTIKTHRESHAIIVDQFKIDGLLLLLSAEGKWVYKKQSSQVDINGHIKVPSLGKFLLALGRERTVRDGNTQLTGNISWQGGLLDVNKEILNGKLLLSSEKGAFIDAKPGAAGRLLGLLNMNELVRRLSFDFNDISKEGFDFDTIEGHGHISKGTFFIDDFLITSPSAKIFISGNTNLITEQFDQQVIVIPEVSSTLPLAGAAVAGPAGAAVVWIGQKLLGDELNKLTAYGYTIKGDWHNPLIEKTKLNRANLQKIKKVITAESSGLKVNGLEKNDLKKNSPEKKDDNPFFNRL